jgi:hypothetical protein
MDYYRGCLNLRLQEMFTMNDVIQEIYDEFPELEHKAIDKICHHGLIGILKIMRHKEEIIIKSLDKEVIKFFYPCSPEKNSELTLNNVRRRRNALKKQNGEASK